MSDVLTSNASAAPTRAPIQVTRQLYDQLTAQLEQLRTTQRPILARRAQRARLFMAPTPDGSIPNGAIFDLEILDQKIADPEALLANAHVINPTPSSTAKLGSTVTVRYDDGTEEKLTLVSALEADPARGYVASDSPAGKALLGKASGEKVTVDADGTAVTLTIEHVGSPSATA